MGLTEKKRTISKIDILFQFQNHLNFKPLCMQRLESFTLHFNYFMKKKKKRKRVDKF